MESFLKIESESESNCRNRTDSLRVRDRACALPKQQNHEAEIAVWWISESEIVQMLNLWWNIFKINMYIYVKGILITLVAFLANYIILSLNLNELFEIYLI